MSQVQQRTQIQSYTSNMNPASQNAVLPVGDPVLQERAILQYQRTYFKKFRAILKDVTAGKVFFDYAVKHHMRRLANRSLGWWRYLASIRRRYDAAVAHYHQGVIAKSYDWWRRYAEHFRDNAAYQRIKINKMMVKAKRGLARAETSRLPGLAGQGRNTVQKALSAKSREVAFARSKRAVQPAVREEP